MHQKGYNEGLHVMEVWLLSWKKHWFVCPAHGGFASGICNLKSCWCWFVAILKCRPWERGLHMRTCIWVTLAWSNWYWITCRKASESFFGGKLVFQLFFLYLECLFSLRHPNFFENSERLKSDTLESFMATNRHIFFLFALFFISNFWLLFWNFQRQKRCQGPHLISIQMDIFVCFRKPETWTRWFWY